MPCPKYFGPENFPSGNLNFERLKNERKQNHRFSTFHDKCGNPQIRGQFEKGRGWYHGPGVATYAAAIRFLQELILLISNGETPVYLAEAFLSFKKNRTPHGDDAKIIHDLFWDTQPEYLQEGIEPISDSIDGVPSIKVFKSENKSEGEI